MTVSDNEDDLIKSAYNDNLPGVDAALAAIVRQGKYFPWYLRRRCATVYELFLQV